MPNQYRPRAVFQLKRDPRHPTGSRLGRRQLQSDRGRDPRRSHLVRWPADDGRGGARADEGHGRWHDPQCRGVRPAARLRCRPRHRHRVLRSGRQGLACRSWRVVVRVQCGDPPDAIPGERDVRRQSPVGADRHPDGGRRACRDPRVRSVGRRPASWHRHVADVDPRWHRPRVRRQARSQVQVRAGREATTSTARRRSGDVRPDRCRRLWLRSQGGTSRPPAHGCVARERAGRARARRPGAGGSHARRADDDLGHLWSQACR